MRFFAQVSQDEAPLKTSSAGRDAHIRLGEGLLYRVSSLTHRSPKRASQSGARRTRPANDTRTSTRSRKPRVPAKNGNYFVFEHG